MKKSFIDELKVIKKRVLKTNYLRSTRKIKIDKSNVRKVKNKKTRRLALWTIIACLLSVFAIFTQTIYFDLFQLALRMQNKSLLIGFQNSGELRPTGGFWGSFAILEAGKTLNDSELLFETNPYKKDNILLNKSEVELPTPMAQTWTDRPQSFVNANWSFNFPEAAKTLEWYFAQGWNQKVDGVIAISSLTVIDLLKIIGPVNLPDGTAINSDNFTETMSKKIDEEYWLDPKNIEVNEPKTLIKELAPELIDRASKVSKIKLIQFVFSQMKQGHISLFFNDEENQKIAQELDLSGEMKQCRSDCLAIINANLNGGKTSLNVEQSVSYYSEFIDQQVMGHLEITRAHKIGSSSEIQNRNWTRVVAPLGSKLIDIYVDGQSITNDVEIKDEEGRTTFGFWLSTDPGQTKIATVNYTLPIYGTKNYSLIYQKQPGTITEHLSISKLGKTVFEGAFNSIYHEF